MASAASDSSAGLEVEPDLRLFAMRRALMSAESNRVVVSVVPSQPDHDCPMHGHGSRATSVSRRGSSVASSSDGGYDSHTVPRRQSRPRSVVSPTPYASSSMDRKGSVQPTQAADTWSNKPVPRDVFRNRVDFKTILRRFDPKEEERASGGGRHHGRSERSLEPRDASWPVHHAPGPRRGTLVESDFDFRLNANSALREPSWDNPGRFRHRSASNSSHADMEPQRPWSPRRNQLRLDIEVANSVTSGSTPQSPIGRRCESTPMSPRRVEFGDEVIFDFNPRGAIVVSPTTTMTSTAVFKPILRHTTSDPNSKKQPAVNLMAQFERKVSDDKSRQVPLTIQHTNSIHESDSSESLVKIFVPQQSRAAADDGGDETDSTLEDDVPVPTASSASLSRSVPPRLAEWNRSQSFPLPVAAAPKSEEHKKRSSLQEFTHALSKPTSINDGKSPSSSRCARAINGTDIADELGFCARPSPR
jgi:hypothetical protein